MKIVIIGNGNVATVLGRKLKAAGHNIIQVFGRNINEVNSLANELGAEACTDNMLISQVADIYIIAVSDKALEQVCKQLKLSNQLVVHTAGSVSMDVLKDLSPNYGVLYPYQTIRKEVTPVPEIPFFIDASNEASKKQLFKLAGSISRKVSEANDHQRIQYHLCAIMVNNFSNYFYAVAAQYCNEHQLDFNNLLPLITETANRLQQFPPNEVQTGPAIRNDIETIQKHKDLLAADPELKKLYALLSEHILRFKWQQAKPL